MPGMAPSESRLIRNSTSRRRNASEFGEASGVAEPILGHRLVMRAVAREVALEQDEAVDLERLRGEAAVALEEGVGGASAAAVPAGERDVRVEGSPLGLDSGPGAGTLDPGGQVRDRRLRLDPGP